jgi:FKBP-type peptidyl-prolyl cis-trans isomerase SlyD
MKIQENSLVTIAYRILDQTGELFEEGHGDEATDYIHGHGELPPGVEETLEGQEVGFSADIRLDIETGFGPVDPELIIGVPLSELGEDVELSKGDILPVEIATDEGEVTGEVDMTVVEVRADTVFLDANHPLAGQNVSFSAEVIAVREATQEELADLEAEHQAEHVHDENCNHG